jgi:hypothetical protein
VNPISVDELTPHVALQLTLFCFESQVGVQTEVDPETAGTSYLEDKVNAVLPLQNKDEADNKEG